MKNLHGAAREAAINAQIDKLELLDKAGKAWGLEDDSTIELYRMKERGESYATMLAFYNLVNASIEDNWFEEI